MADYRGAEKLRKVETVASKATYSPEKAKEKSKHRARKHKKLEGMGSRLNSNRKFSHITHPQKDNSKSRNERVRYEREKRRREKDKAHKRLLHIPDKVIGILKTLKTSQESEKRSDRWSPDRLVKSFWETKISKDARKPLTEKQKQEEFELIRDLMGRKKTTPMVTLNLLKDVLRGERLVYERDVYNRQVTRDPNQFVKSDEKTYHISLYRKKRPIPHPIMRSRKNCEENLMKIFPHVRKIESILHKYLADWDNRAPITDSSTTSIPSSVISSSSHELIPRDEDFVPFNEDPLNVYPVAADITREDMKINYVQGFYHDQRNFHEKVRFLRYYNFTVPMQIVLSEKDYGCSFLVDNILPIDFLIDLGFNSEEAAACLLDLKLKARIVASVREAQIWSRFITRQQGGLILVMCWLMSRKEESKSYLLPFVEAIVNCRITSCNQIEAHMRLLCDIDRKARRKIRLLPKVINIPMLLRRGPIKIKEILLTFVMDLYAIANEVSQYVRGCNVGNKEAELIEHIALNFQTPILNFLDILGTYIGYKLMTTKQQVDAALKYLSEQKSTDIDIEDFERVCDIDGREMNRYISKAVVDEVMKEIIHKSVRKPVSSESESASETDMPRKSSTIEREWADLWQEGHYRSTREPSIMSLKKDLLKLRLGEKWPQGEQTLNRTEISHGHETDSLRCMPNQYINISQERDNFRQDKNECLSRIGPHDVFTRLHTFSDPFVKDIHPPYLHVHLERDSPKLGNDRTKQLSGFVVPRRFEEKHDTQAAVECVLARLRAIQRGDLGDGRTRASIERDDTRSRDIKQSKEGNGTNSSDAAKIRNTRKSRRCNSILKSQSKYLPEEQLSRFLPITHVGNQSVEAGLIIGAKKCRKHLTERINCSQIDTTNEEFDIEAENELTGIPRKEMMQEQRFDKLNTILEETVDVGEKNRSGAQTGQDDIGSHDSMQGGAVDGKEKSYIANKGRNDREFQKYIDVSQYINDSVKQDKHTKQSSIAEERSKDMKQRIRGVRTCKDGIGQRDVNNAQGKSEAARRDRNVEQQYSVVVQNAHGAQHFQRNCTAEKSNSKLVKTEFDIKQNGIPLMDRSYDYDNKQSIPLAYHAGFWPFTEYTRDNLSSTKRFQEVTNVMRLTERSDQMKDVNEVLRTYSLKLKDALNSRARNTSSESLQETRDYKPQDKSPQTDEINCKSLDHGTQSQIKLFHKRDSSELLRYIYTELKKKEINDENNQNDLIACSIKPQETHIRNHGQRDIRQNDVSRSRDYYRAEHCNGSQLHENREISYDTHRVPSIPSDEINIIHYPSNTISINESSSSTNSDSTTSEEHNIIIQRNKPIESHIKQGERKFMSFESRKREQEPKKRFFQWNKKTQLLRERDTNQRRKLFDIKTRKTKTESKTSTRTEQWEKYNGQQGITSNSDSQSSDSSCPVQKEIADIAQSKIKLYINLYKEWKNRKKDSQKKYHDSTSRSSSSKVSMDIRKGITGSQDIHLQPREIQAEEQSINSNLKYYVEPQSIEVKQEKFSKKDPLECEWNPGQGIQNSEKQVNETESNTSTSTTQWDIFNVPKGVKFQSDTKYSRSLCHSRNIGQLHRDRYPQRENRLALKIHHDVHTSSSTSSSSSRATIKPQRLRTPPRDKRAERDEGCKSSIWINENKDKDARLSETCRLLYEGHTQRNILNVGTKKYETDPKLSPSITQKKRFNILRDDWSERERESSMSLKQRSEVRGVTFQTQDRGQLYSDISAKRKSRTTETPKMQHDSDTSSSSSSSASTIIRLDETAQSRVKGDDGRGANTVSRRCDTGAKEQVFYEGQDPALFSLKNEQNVRYGEAQKTKSASSANFSLIQRDRQLFNEVRRRSMYTRPDGSEPRSKLIQLRRLDQSTPAKTFEPMNRDSEEMNIETESKSYSSLRLRDHRDERQDELSTSSSQNHEQQNNFSLRRYVSRFFGFSTESKNSKAQEQESQTRSFTNSYNASQNRISQANYKQQSLRPPHAKPWSTRAGATGIQTQGNNNIGLRVTHFTSSSNSAGDRGVEYDHRGNDHEKQISTAYNLLIHQDIKTKKQPGVISNIQTEPNDRSDCPRVNIIEPHNTSVSAEGHYENLGREIGTISQERKAYFNAIEQERNISVQPGNAEKTYMKMPKLLTLFSKHHVTTDSRVAHETPWIVDESKKHCHKLKSHRHKLTYLITPQKDDNLEGDYVAISTKGNNDCKIYHLENFPHSATQRSLPTGDAQTLLASCIENESNRRRQKSAPVRHDDVNPNCKIGTPSGVNDRLSVNLTTSNDYPVGEQYEIVGPRDRYHKCKIWKEDSHSREGNTSIDSGQQETVAVGHGSLTRQIRNVPLNQEHGLHLNASEKERDKYEYVPLLNSKMDNNRGFDVNRLRSVEAKTRITRDQSERKRV